MTMKATEIFNKIRYTTISYDTKWAKVYMGSKTCSQVLLSFPPSAYPSFIQQLERKGCRILRLCNYDEGLGFIAFLSKTPYQDLAETLQGLSGHSPLPITHKGKA